jgi:hypothetical protein
MIAFAGPQPNVTKVRDSSRLSAVFSIMPYLLVPPPPCQSCRPPEPGPDNFRPACRQTLSVPIFKSLVFSLSQPYSMVRFQVGRCDRGHTAHGPFPPKSTILHCANPRRDSRPRLSRAGLRPAKSIVSGMPTRSVGMATFDGCAVQSGTRHGTAKRAELRSAGQPGAAVPTCWTCLGAAVPTC